MIGGDQPLGMSLASGRAQLLRQQRHGKEVGDDRVAVPPLPHGGVRINDVASECSDGDILLGPVLPDFVGFFFAQPILPALVQMHVSINAEGVGESAQGPFGGVSARLEARLALLAAQRGWSQIRPRNSTTMWAPR